MSIYKHHKYPVLAIMLLSGIALSCNMAQAVDKRAQSLMQCLNTAHFNPINSGTAESIPASRINADSFNTTQLAHIDVSNVIAGPLSQDNLFHLSNGNALFTPKKDISVLTALAKVNIGAGSAVCIIKPEPGVISIYNLHANANNKVSIEIGQKTFALAPGMQATVCYQVCNFESINPAKRIAYRNLKEIDLPAGIRLYSAEFSITSAMTHIRPLQIMLASNAKDDLKLADQLVKNSVVLEYLYDNSEPYSVAAEPQPEPTMLSVNHLQDNGQEIAHKAVSNN